MTRLMCVVPDDEGGGHWRRHIRFPFTPFPGLEVGSLGPVTRVLVCQGDLDGAGGVEVHFAPNCLDRGILASHGWEYVT